MKKLFAYAAIALMGAGALIVTTHSDAKPGAGPGFKGHWAFAHHHGAHPHHFAFLHGFHHHHHFARRFEFGFPGFVDYAAPYAAEPVIVEVPQEGDDVTGSTNQRRVSVRGGYPGGAVCSAEYVTVPASQGGETTVRIVRC